MNPLRNGATLDQGDPREELSKLTHGAHPVQLSGVFPMGERGAEKVKEHRDPICFWYRRDMHVSHPSPAVLWGSPTDYPSQEGAG